MATTKTKKNTKEEVVDSKKAKTHPLIKSPRITEKAALGAEKGIYTFNVTDNATKNEIKKAIKLIYGVTPLRVSTTKITSKTVVRRGIIGTKKGGRKAVVYLKKGDKIAIA
ncbi:50S ribosomal protein L23 [Candidatus Dojkabacteria bacterium]|jgi:large subunit ribosomal protein L23|nr:50S ribosomal protein L23 [Candidatus Dojkabacteria bacterium]